MSSSWAPLLQFSSPLPPPDFHDIHAIKKRSPGKRKLRVLVVDDERLIADTLSEILAGSGFEVVTAYDGKMAVKLAIEFCPDILISDVIMPETNGIELAKIVTRQCPTARVLLLSGQAATNDLLEGARKEGYDFELLAKPLHPSKLLKKLR